MYEGVFLIVNPCYELLLNNLSLFFSLPTLWKGCSWGQASQHNLAFLLMRAAYFSLFEILSNLKLLLLKLYGIFSLGIPYLPCRYDEVIISACNSMLIATYIHTNALKNVWKPCKRFLDLFKGNCVKSRLPLCPMINLFSSMQHIY